MAEREQTQIEREQAAFEAQLPALLSEHAGEYVVFHGEEPVSFFPTYDEAYRAGLAQFGLDEPFLVSQVVERDRAPASVSWFAGVLFGQS